MLHRPHLLLLDEATVGLDIRSRAEIIGHVRRLVAEEGMGVLWATHLIEEVSPEDFVVILHQGKVVGEGSVPDLVRAHGGQNIKSAFMSLVGPAKVTMESSAA